MEREKKKETQKNEKKKRKKKKNSPEDLPLLHLGPLLDRVAFADALALDVPAPAQEPDLRGAQQQRADAGVFVVERHLRVERRRRRRRRGAERGAVHARGGGEGGPGGRRRERGGPRGDLHGRGRGSGARGRGRGEAVAGADDAELEGAEADVELGELGLLAEDGEQGLDLSLLCGIGREREGEWSIEEGE